MANSLANVASRLITAGYDPVTAHDIEHSLNRLAGRLGRSFLLADPHGVASWTVTSVDPEAMTAALVCGDRSMTAGPEDLRVLFGARGADRLN